MNFDLAECGIVKFVQQAMKYAVEILGIEPGDELGDLLLGDRWRQVDVPSGEAGKGLRIAREQAVQEGRSAA